MGKRRVAKRAIAIFLIAGLAVFMFAGCKKSGSGSSNGNGFNSSQRQAEIKKSLDTLVANQTINKTQETKILSVMTSSTGFGRRSGSGSRPSGGSASSGSSRPSWSRGSSGSGSRPNFSSGSSGSGWQNSFNPLSSLVKDGTITQQQADAVLQQIMGSMGGGFRGAGQNNSGNSSSSAS